MKLMVVRWRSPKEVLNHDAEGRERDRLSRGAGRLEELRTTELLARWLPPAPAVILDVGGAAGRYALPLAAAGYEVHLVDPVPLHVAQAQEASRAASRPLASVQIGDARTLGFDDGSADAVLLLGPIYHLVEREERLKALREAGRVGCETASPLEIATAGLVSGLKARRASQR